METLLLQLGVGGIFAILILKTVFDFLTKKKDEKKNGNGNGLSTVKVALQIKDLWDWHNISDEDGVKLWYFRRSLEPAVHKLAENIESQTRILQMLADRLERIERDLDKVT